MPPALRRLRIGRHRLCARGSCLHAVRESLQWRATATSCRNRSVLQAAALRPRARKRRDRGKACARRARATALRCRDRKELSRAPETIKSVHVLATIDRDGRSGDEACFIGDKEENAAGYLVGFAETSDGDFCHDLFEHVRR